jgi:hypothetical protein
MQGGTCARSSSSADGDEARCPAAARSRRRGFAGGKADHLEVAFVSTRDSDDRRQRSGAARGRPRVAQSRRRAHRPCRPIRRVAPVAFAITNGLNARLAVASRGAVSVLTLSFWRPGRTVYNVSRAATLRARGLAVVLVPN